MLRFLALFFGLSFIVAGLIVMTQMQGDPNAEFIAMMTGFMPGIALFVIGIIAFSVNNSTSSHDSEDQQ